MEQGRAPAGARALPIHEMADSILECFTKSRGLREFGEVRFENRTRFRRPEGFEEVIGDPDPDFVRLGMHFVGELGTIRQQRDDVLEIVAEVGIVGPSILVRGQLARQDERSGENANLEVVGELSDDGSLDALGVPRIRESEHIRIDRHDVEDVFIRSPAVDGVVLVGRLPEAEITQRVSDPTIGGICRGFHDRVRIPRGPHSPGCGVREVELGDRSPDEHQSVQQGLGACGDPHESIEVGAHGVECPGA